MLGDGRSAIVGGLNTREKLVIFVCGGRESRGMQYLFEPQDPAKIFI